MEWFCDLASPEESEEDRLSPLDADLRGFPSTVVSTAEHDPSRDQGDEMARRLDAAAPPTALGDGTEVR